MSEKTKIQINWLIDVIFKVGTPIALACLYFLKSNFVSVEDARKIENRIGDAETAIKLMVKENEINARQDKILEDHEQRLRRLAEHLK